MWEIDAREIVQPYEYGDNALRAATKIMTSVCMDKMWDKQQTENTPLEKRCEQAEALGDDLRNLIKKHLGVDPHDFYKNL